MKIKHIIVILIALMSFSCANIPLGVTSNSSNSGTITYTFTGVYNNLNGEFLISVYDRIDKSHEKYMKVVFHNGENMRFRAFSFKTRVPFFAMVIPLKINSSINIKIYFNNKLITSDTISSYDEMVSGIIKI